MRVLVGFSLTSIASGATCMVDHFHYVSQSITGTYDVTDTQNSQIIRQYTGSFTTKVDTDNFNLYMDSQNGDSTKRYAGILNLTANTEYHYLKRPLDDGTIYEECHQMEAGSLYWSILGEQYRRHDSECASSDGTYDTWTLSMEYYGESIDDEYEATADQLLHSKKSTWSFTYYGDDLGSVWEENVLSAQLGGPSAADLDPAQFGVECQQWNSQTAPFPDMKLGSLGLLPTLRAKRLRHAMTDDPCAEFETKNKCELEGERNHDCVWSKHTCHTVGVPPKDVWIV